MIDTGFISQIERSAKACSLQVDTNVPGSNVSTYKIGGPLSCVITLRNQVDIENLLKCEPLFSGVLNSSNVTTIGRGSNILIDDEGFSGVVFMFAAELTQLNSDPIENEGYLSIQAPAGLALPIFARQCAIREMAGTEFFVGIPGSIGGAVRMNAGGHGRQTSETLIHTDVIDLNAGVLKTYKNAECEFSYRHSRFGATDLIIGATFKGVHDDRAAIEERINEIVSWRRENQPGGRNIGSVFQNPQNTSAGQLIEECGLKGYRIGGAYVSDKHANFIQADDTARSSDVHRLIEHIKNVVKDVHGVELKTEVQYIGNSYG